MLRRARDVRYDVVVVVPRDRVVVGRRRTASGAVQDGVLVLQHQNILRRIRQYSLRS